MTSIDYHISHYQAACHQLIKGCDPKDFHRIYINKNAALCAIALEAGLISEIGNAKLTQSEVDHTVAWIRNYQKLYTGEHGMKERSYHTPLCVTQDKICGFSSFQQDEDGNVSYDQWCHCNLIGESCRPDGPICEEAKRSIPLQAALLECEELNDTRVKLHQEHESLQLSLREAKSKHEKELVDATNRHKKELDAMKADMLTTLKAIELIAIASKRDSQADLTHRKRDERIEHLQAVIANCFLDFNDRKFSSYEEDF